MFYSLLRKKIVQAANVTATYKQLSPVDFYKIRLKKDFTSVIGEFQYVMWQFEPAPGQKMCVECRVDMSIDYIFPSP